VSEADVTSWFAVHRNRRRRRAGGAVVAAAIVLTALVGCTKSADSSTPVTAGAIPSAASSSATAAEAAGKAAVDAYDAALSYEVVAYAKMNSTTAEMRKYLGEPDLDGATFLGTYFRSQGVIYTGKPTWQATPTNVDLIADPPVVTLSVCFATNGWEPIYKSSGKPYSPSNDPPRKLEIASVTKVKGVWLLTQEAVQGRPC
jgi:hypothetical protein